MIIKAMKNEDRYKVMELIKIVFPTEYKDIEHIIFQNKKPKNYVYIEINNKICALAGMVPEMQRFGNKELKVGEISVVGTHPQYRKQGLSKNLINYWIKYMKDKNISLSFLYGIPNYYEQYGFYYSVPAHFTSYVNADKKIFKDIRGKYKVEILNDQSDKICEELNIIYSESCKDNFCTSIRSVDYWQDRIKVTSRGEFKWYVIKYENGIKGYVWMSLKENRITLREVGLIDEEAARTLAGFLYETLDKYEQINNIGMQLPLNNDFSVFVFKHGAKFSCTNEIYPESYAGMYRINDLKAVFETLIGCMEKRLADSKFYNKDVLIGIRTEESSVIIDIKEGKIKILNGVEEIQNPIKNIIYISMEYLTPIITGYRDVSYFQDKIDFRNQDNYDLLKVLLPLTNPYIWDLEMRQEL